MVPILKLLGDRTRLTIIMLLDVKQCCVCELTEILRISQPAVSQHLRKLRDARLVKEERRGQWIYYSLNKEAEFYPFVESILEYVPEQEQYLEEMQHTKRKNMC